MKDQFTAELHNRLTAEDREVMQELRDAGFVPGHRAGPAKFRPSKDADADQMALDIAAHAYRRLATGWMKLYRNGGLTDDETFQRRVLDKNEDEHARDGVVKPRSFPQAYKDMAASFETIVEDAVKAINEASKDAGIEVDDVMGRIEFSHLMKRVIEIPLLLPIEPIYALQGLFRTLNLPGLIGNTLDVPMVALSALEAHKIGEDAEVPMKTIDLSIGNITAKFSKIGVGVNYSDDFARFSGFDFYTALVDACRKALAREREWQAFYHLDNHGIDVIDNTGRFGFSGAPVAGTAGTAGVGLDGQYNGGHVIQDIFFMMTSFVEAGLFPDTVVLSPKAWQIWAQDQDMRNFAFQNGMPKLYQTPTGRPGYANEHEVLGGLFAAQPAPTLAGTQSEMPNMIPLPLRTIVSPFMGAATDAGGGGGTVDYTNAMMLDVNAGVGYFVRNMDPTMTEWKDNDHDIRKVKWIERYAFGSLKGSTAIRHMRKLKTSVVTFDVRDRLVFSMQRALGADPKVGNPS